MALLLAAMGLMALGGTLAFLSGTNARVANTVGAASAATGCALGLVPALRAVIAGTTESASIAWTLPDAALALKLDPLSGFFLIPTLFVAGWAAIYGAGYLAPEAGKRPLGTSWFCYNLLTVSMMLVLTANNGILFLLAWEIMSLVSFLLVTFEHEKPSVREAGWTYLVATHIGTAFLLVMFVLMYVETGSFDFDAAAGLASGFRSAGVIFICAVIGFGTKAGFMPLHVWLPEAHPAAPSHVSAVMSGVMIKTGIYGLVRTVVLIGHVPPWWGWLIVGIGLSSGILGVVFALAQHDLKRLLAYHSVENIGIIALGLGLGLLGVAYQSPTVAALGFAGGLLHVVNHALFKGLLFMGAGAVLHGAGTGEIDQLGGLMKRMPWTGAAFLFGSVAICGLPPLNGFVSELMIYSAAFRGIIPASPDRLAIAAAGAIGGLALIGGLAAACFTKAFGIIFLGEPRSEHAAHAHEAGPAMKAAMVALVSACIAVALFPGVMAAVMGNVLAAIPAIPGSAIAPGVKGVAASLTMVVAAVLALLALSGLLALLRRSLLSGRQVGRAGTWDCGYARPTARMQYTSSSYAQPLTILFKLILRTRSRLALPVGFFPDAKSSLATETPDTFKDLIFSPLFRFWPRLFVRLQALQQGQTQLYLIYIVIVLIVLLVWNLGGGQ